MNAYQTRVAWAEPALTQLMGTIAFVHLDFLELIVKQVCMIEEKIMFLAGGSLALGDR
jgi:hypothetical protein